MALRDQPYIPLYVQDVLTDEKLVECSASSHGIYFRLICILHKQEKYGLLYLKQKYKQSESKFKNFALMLSKQMPFDEALIEISLQELYNEDVIKIEEDNLFQKRMVKDGELSLIRSSIGKTGGSSVTKQYGKRGFLYFMSDGYDANKIGISVNPQNRLYRLRSDLKLPKHFDIIDSVEVEDMGKSEDDAHIHFNTFMDGEWIKLPYEKCKEMFVLLKAKYKAKSLPNSEYENEYENDNTDKTKLIPQMINIWKSQRPDYLIDQQKDFTSLLEIATKLGEVKKYTQSQVLEEKKDEILNYFKQVVDWVNKDSFYSTIQISSINNQFQTIYGKMLAEHKKSTKKDIVI